MRLGAYECVIEPDTKAFEAYKERVIFERHRHRYEFNPAFEEKIASCGLKISGPQSGLRSCRDD